MDRGVEEVWGGRCGGVLMCLFCLLFGVVAESLKVLIRFGSDWLGTSDVCTSHFCIFSVK